MSWKDSLPASAKAYIGERQLDEVECIISDFPGVPRAPPMPDPKPTTKTTPKPTPHPPPPSLAVSPVGAAEPQATRRAPAP